MKKHWCKTVKTYNIRNQTHFKLMLPSIPSENTRKPDVSRRFRKGTSRNLSKMVKKQGAEV